MKPEEKQQRLVALIEQLKRMARYQSVEQLRKNSQKQYGLDAEEAIECAYENLQSEAKLALSLAKRVRL